jgi:uncharacterized protein
MAVEWDPAKARSNLRKHGIRFADAVSALEDEGAISVRDEREDEERAGSVSAWIPSRVFLWLFTHGETSRCD